MLPYARFLVKKISAFSPRSRRKSGKILLVDRDIAILLFGAIGEQIIADQIVVDKPEVIARALVCGAAVSVARRASKRIPALVFENTRSFAFLGSLPVVRNVGIELTAGNPRSAVNRSGDRGAVVVFIAPE